MYTKALSGDQWSGRDGSSMQFSVITDSDDSSVHHVIFEHTTIIID